MIVKIVVVLVIVVAEKDKLEIWNAMEGIIPKLVEEIGK